MEINEKNDSWSNDDGRINKDERVGNTGRRFAFPAARRQREKIRRVCANALHLYRQVELEMPQSSRMERYVQVVERRSSAHPRAILRIMRLVRKGFALWPAEGPLNFRDVVQYIAVTDCLTAQSGGGAGRRDVDCVSDIIAEMIPPHL
jgi:hypothetical protein